MGSGRARSAAALHSSAGALSSQCQRIAQLPAAAARHWASGLACIVQLWIFISCSGRSLAPVGTCSSWMRGDEAMRQETRHDLQHSRC